jgi:lysophospholipase
VLLQGRTEFLEKYAGVAADLRARGFAVAALDWRGQGGSARLLKNPRKGHIDDFADYGHDLAALMAAPAVAAIEGPRLLIAHSMGGCTGLRALARPFRFRAALLSAPMWGLAHPWAVQRLARTLSRAAVRAGLGGTYAAGGGDAPYAGQGFADNRLTSCPEQYAAIARLTADHPHLALGGATWGWVRAAFAEMDALWAQACPVPAFVALGGDEAIVSSEAIRRRAVRDGMALLDLPGARHEPFFETAAIRARLWDGIDGFLAAQGL